MAKILFVNPVVREEDVPRHIPYGIAMLAQIAINNGHQVQVYDANAWRKGFDIQEIVSSWDLRLLDQASKNWVAPKEGESVAIPQKSSNFVQKKIQAPVSNDSSSIYLEVR
jgi:anaerobic magnesium-protoporphyrin IX monomethyl ester cyclase